MSLNPENPKSVGRKLSADFYQRDNVVQISRELIGKILCSRIDGVLTRGRIVETEAYDGLNDQACHSHLGRRTRRTEIMYQAGGVAYVYLIYGIHSLFNIVANKEGKADAVLIRAVEPLTGEDIMLLRRNLPKISSRLTAGPGLVTQALGINTSHYGTDLSGDLIWLEEDEFEVPDSEIIASPRVGVDYAGEDAKLPWRFRLTGSPWTSKAR